MAAVSESYRPELGERVVRRLDSPVFSIILPTYNRADMLQRAVTSVRQQTFENFELIVVDDGSQENYCAALEDLADPRILVIRSPQNRGQASARNLGLDAARGTYLSFIDDDDEYLSSFLTSTYARLGDTPPHVGLSWCSIRSIKYPTGLAGVARVQFLEFPTEHPHKRALFEDFTSIGTGFGVTIKASCLRQVGPFDAGLRAVEDTDMFFRILANGFVPVVVSGGAHVVRHEHRSQRLTGIAMHPVRIQECKLLLERHSKFLGRYPSLRDRQLDYIDQLEDELGAPLSRRRNVLARDPLVKRALSAVSNLLRR